MIWSCLGKKELQEFIGEDILNQLEEVQGALDNGTSVSNDIYAKSNLIKIFSSFVTVEFFKSRENITSLLNFVKKENLDELGALYNIPDFSSFPLDFKVSKIASMRWTDRSKCLTFLKWAGLPDCFAPVIKEPFVAEEVCRVSDAPYKILKDYQIPIFLKAQKELDNNLARFVLQMPTGSGKTRTAMEVITDFINSSTEPGVVVWLVHSEELCEQAHECFSEVWSHVAKKRLILCRCWGKEGKLPESLSSPAFIVAGFQKMYSLLIKDPDAFSSIKDKVKLIIVDEAHKVIAPTYEKVTKSLMGLNTKVIGLTATPGRSFIDHEQNRALSDFFFNLIFSIETPEGVSVISYLRDKNILSKLLVDPIISTTEIQMDSSEKKYIEKYFDFPPGFLERIGKDHLRNIEIIKRLERECQNKKNIIFFSCSVEHSKFICSMLLYLGYKAVHVDGSTDKGLRKQHINDFKNGLVQVICNYGVLSTGFDAPKTDVICISRPTASIVLYSQMVGRGLRGPGIGGTPTCKLINVRDNIQGFPSYSAVFDYFNEYWS